MFFIDPEHKKGKTGPDHELYGKRLKSPGPGTGLIKKEMGDLGMLTVLSIIFGVLLIAGGVSCLVLPELTFMTLGYIIGVVMIVDGIGMIIAWFQRDRRRKGNGWVLAGGIISLLLGITLIGNGFLQLAMNTFIIYMVIAWLLILGIMRIILAFQTRAAYKELQKADKNATLGRNWWIALILGILMVVAAIACLTSEYGEVIVAHTIGILMGIGVIITGVDMIHFGTTAWMIDD